FPATATISGFTGATLDPGSLTTQAATGTLPGTIVESNSNADYFEGIQFGSSLSFLLDLAGTPGGSVGDVFTLSFYNSTLDGALLTGNENDLWLVQFQMDTAGNVTSTAYANPSGGASFATITPEASAPEPSGIFLGLIGALMIALTRLRSRR